LTHALTTNPSIDAPQLDLPLPLNRLAIDWGEAVVLRGRHVDLILWVQGTPLLEIRFGSSIDLLKKQIQFMGLRATSRSLTQVQAALLSEMNRKTDSLTTGEHFHSPLNPSQRNFLPTSRQAQSTFL
jgi:hypothetical protein